MCCHAHTDLTDIAKDLAIQVHIRIYYTLPILLHKQAKWRYIVKVAVRWTITRAELAKQ